MKKLTAKQKLVLNKLKEHITTNGYAPTNRELAEMVGLQSVSTVHGHLQRLQKQGYIEIVGVRAIKIPDKQEEGEQ